MNCERCGWALRVGDWPYCGHGRDHRPAVVNVITDDIPGGQVIETLDHEEMTFYSKKAIRDAADARGLRIKDEWAGPHDKHLTNWAAGIDAKTLENVTTLLSRGAQLSTTDNRDHLQTYQGSIKTIKTLAEVE